MPTTRSFFHAVACALLSAGVASAASFPGYEELRKRAEACWKGERGPGGAYLVLVPRGSPLNGAVIEAFVRFTK